MASFLEIGLLQNFSLIFPAILVFVVIYAILQKTKLLGDKSIVNALIAIAAGFLVMLSKDIVHIISFMTPWFIVLAIAILLMLMIYKLMGATDENIAHYLTTDKTIQWTLFVLGLIIIIATIANVYGSRLIPADSETAAIDGESTDIASNVQSAIFNPKVLGMILIMLIAAFTIGIITMEGTKNR